MANKLNINSNMIEDLNTVVSSEGFSNLPKNIQTELLHKMTNDEKGGGIMGKIFGNDPELSPLYAVIFLCFILLIVGIIIYCISKEMQIWTVIIPTFTTLIGFFFGRSGKKD